MKHSINEASITRVECQAYRVPTDFPEADGTLAWDATTLVVVHVYAGSVSGMGYTYGDACIVGLIRDTLAKEVIDGNGLDIEALWQKMWRQVRNAGRSGLAATAISAIDTALWDLKAKLLDMPLTRLLGMARPSMPIYGSGGFTSYDERRTAAQLSRWIEVDGCQWVKMKIGHSPQVATRRVAAARAAIGSGAGLFVDANGAMDAKAATSSAAAFVDQGVEWFEEPVSSDDLPTLHALRNAVPAPIRIAAGEYGYTSDYFRRMLSAQSVDVLQADLTRCGGVTGFLRAAALSESFHVPLSAHCAPALHLHAACSASGMLHQEWFHDHVRIESMLFDGAPKPAGGRIFPDLSRPGCGLELKQPDARPYLIS